MAAYDAKNYSDDLDNCLVDFKYGTSGHQQVRRMLIAWYLRNTSYFPLRRVFNSVKMPKSSHGKEKATSNRRNPVSKDPKASHLYTDDNPETTLKSTGFKDAKTANHTLALIKNRSLTYRFQLINTMFNRAKHHPNRNQDIEAAMNIFETWLKETYPSEKQSLRDFKPVLSKDIVSKYLDDMNKTGNIDTTFAEIYVGLAPKKRLANSLMDPKRPDLPDLERARYDRLCELLPANKDEERQMDLWNSEWKVSPDHLELIAYAYSPISEKLLAKAIGK